MYERPPATRSQQVLIIGAGFGGIAAAIELRRHGFTDVRILEKAPDLGGTWFYNSYPGAACDVPSHLYSFSYAQRRNWSQLCSPRAEIHAYMHEVAREYGVERLVQTDTEVSACAWDAERCRWSVQTTGGATHEADVLVIATGQLDRPAVPRIEGAEEFAGHSFHSAEWDHDYALAGKRVAVIGTGASAVQFVPEIAPTVRKLSVFQRTGNWFLPRSKRLYSTPFKAAVERVPYLQALRRAYIFEYAESLTLAIRHPSTVGRLGALISTVFMRSQLKDPSTRAKAWPGYTFGCKRILFSSDYLPALERDNVELVTDPIARMTPTGILTAGGREHELDCVIWATGFKTTEFMAPMRVTGTDGVDLHEYWSGGAHAHLGMCVPAFPNMFLLYGPNTNTSGGSIIFYLERQSAYVRQALEQLRTRRAGAIEVRAEAEAASDRELQGRFAGTAWVDCNSWYRDENGRIVTNWPGYMREYMQRTAQLDAAEFHFAPLPATSPEGERVAA